MNFALIGNCLFAIGYYERCCGRLHNSNLPLNLEMINNNHDQDFKTRYTKIFYICVMLDILYKLAITDFKFSIIFFLRMNFGDNLN